MSEQKKERKKERKKEIKIKIGRKREIEIWKENGGKMKVKRGKERGKEEEGGGML